MTGAPIVTVPLPTRHNRLWLSLSASIVTATLLMLYGLYAGFSGGPSGFPTGAAPSSSSTTSAATTICGTSVLASPYNATSLPPGAPPTVVTLSPGTINLASYNTPDTTYFFPYGTYNVTGSVSPGNGDWYFGSYNAGTFTTATLDGGGSTAELFTGTATNVTIEYLLMQNFNPPGNTQWAINHDSGADWTIDYDSAQDIYPGAAIGLGSGDQAEYDCVTHNGEYGIQAYVSDLSSTISPLTWGPNGVTVEHDEISYNDQCNWDAIPTAYFPLGSTLPAGCTEWPNTNAGAYAGCGCAAGAHFWQTNGSNFSYNYVHDNYDNGAWWDTNNNAETVVGNEFTSNFASAVYLEISYNANIQNNTFTDNGWGLGWCAANGQCGESGNIVAAVFLSNAGGDANVASATGSAITIENNTFTNDWDGVGAYDQPNRFCGTQNNSSGFSCALDNPPPVRPTSEWVSATDVTTTYGSQTISSAGGFKANNGTGSVTTPQPGADAWGPNLGQGNVILSCASANSCTLQGPAQASGPTTIYTDDTADTTYVNNNLETSPYYGGTGDGAIVATGSCTGGSDCTITSTAGFKTSVYWSGCSGNYCVDEPAPGDTVYGTDIPSGDTIASCSSAQSCLLTHSATGTGTALTLLAGSPGGCGLADLDGVGASNYYYLNCRWKTANITVEDNTMTWSAAAVTNCTAWVPESSTYCGENALFGQGLSSPAWAPWSGNTILTYLTTYADYADLFDYNSYSTTAWQFVWGAAPYAGGTPISNTAWVSNGQDPHSTF